MAAFGKINVLVNVAGVQGMVADIVELPEDEWYHVLNVNLTSVYLCSKYCIPSYARTWRRLHRQYRINAEFF